MLRVTAGSLRGRRVPVPPGDVRPTSERARQAYFNIAGPRIAGARFLDLFSGSGIFSFEAVSRGAASATAVDQSRRNCETIARLATEWNVPVQTITSDVGRALSPSLGTYDLAYADPPYAYTRYDDLLAAIRPHVAEGGLIAIEHRKRTQPFRTPPDRVAQYGEVWISFFSYAETLCPSS